MHDTISGALREFWFAYRKCDDHDWLVCSKCDWKQIDEFWGADVAACPECGSEVELRLARTSMFELARGSIGRALHPYWVTEWDPTKPELYRKLMWRGRTIRTRQVANRMMREPQ